MTLTRATPPRPLLCDVRAARVGGRVCEAGRRTVWKGIRATTNTVDDACRQGWRARGHSAFASSAP
jgi:hypothetical protein